MGGWRNAVQEAAASKPLFLTIYATVILGIVVSSFYVFSAIYSPSASATQSVSTSWLSSPPLSQNGVPVIIGRSINISQPSTATSQSGSNQLRPIWEPPPSNSKMPPLKSFSLTKELVGERAKDNVIVVTFGNFAFMDFILTWVKHLTDLGVSNLLVGAMDTELLKALYWKGVPVFDMGSHMSTIDVGWGSPTFHKMGREKVLLINAILPFGYELLMCDTDMVWLKNPLPYLARYPDADLLTSSDQVTPTVVDDSLADWKQVGASYNIGIFHWRPTEPAIKLAKEWKDMLLADDKIWDQNGFNELVRKQVGPAVDSDSGLFYAYDGNLKVGVLPESIFCSGHTYFVQAMYEQLRLEPYALHTTFQYAGTEGKRHRLREAMVFYDPPEYYDAPVEEFGPAIDIREYSFLSNPSLPQQVKDSWLDVQLCQEGTEDCHASSNTSRPGLLRFPKRSSEETTREEKFRNRVKRYVGIWCCVDSHNPGHIYYDMYWDEKPDWKPIPPQTPEDDHPPF
ncbi:Reticulon [Corchorus olitorius]|uniref:Reticulon n=1 Tax=Corchorus olitorius TaxID=93759 RepID=A0A1R3JFT1_9ROSI|nr:Reticulon [Corchorus olitorius]